MKYSGVCIMVEDMERAKRFYTEALGQKITMDMERNVAFEGGFAIQSDYEELMGITPSSVTQRSNSFELYFEEDDLDSVIRRLEEYGGVEFFQKKIERPWAQLGTSFYDPDGHLIEVGETLPCLVRRLAASGMDADAVSERTSLPKPMVLHMLG